MGLLDDAIREHLELKRRHGVPDDELERAEQEALGPARRDASAGAGLPPLEEVPGEEVGAVVPPPPPPPPEEDAEDAPPPPVDDPVFADEYAAEPAPADFDEPGLAPEPALPAPPEEPELEEPTDDPAPNSPQGDPDEPDDPHRARTSILDDPLAEGLPADENEDV